MVTIYDKSKNIMLKGDQFVSLVCEGPDKAGSYTIHVDGNIPIDNIDFDKCASILAESIEYNNYSIVNNIGTITMDFNHKSINRDYSDVKSIIIMINQNVDYRLYLSNIEESEMGFASLMFLSPFYKKLSPEGCKSYDVLVEKYNQHNESSEDVFDDISSIGCSDGSDEKIERVEDLSVNELVARARQSETIKTNNTDADITVNDDEKASFYLGLFKAGSVAIYASSADEYEKIKWELVRLGYIIDYTVQSGGWDSVCRYIYIKDSRRACAEYSFEDTTADTTLEGKIFLAYTAKYIV